MKTFITFLVGMFGVNALVYASMIHTCIDSKDVVLQGYWHNDDPYYLVLNRSKSDLTITLEHVGVIDDGRNLIIKSIAQLNNEWLVPAGGVVDVKVDNLKNLVCDKTTYSDCFVQFNNKNAGTDLGLNHLPVASMGAPQTKYVINSSMNCGPEDGTGLDGFWIELDSMSFKANRYNGNPFDIFKATIHVTGSDDIGAVEINTRLGKAEPSVKVPYQLEVKSKTPLFELADRSVLDLRNSTSTHTIDIWDEYASWDANRPFYKNEMNLNAYNDGHRWPGIPVGALGRSRVFSFAVWLK